MSTQAAIEPEHQPTTADASVARQTQAVEATLAATADSFAVDRNKPGRRAAAVEGTILSCVGANESPHNPNDPADVVAMLMVFFRSPEYRELAERLDAEPSERVTGYSYQRSQYLGIQIVSLIGPAHDLKGAHRYVQTQPILRAMLGFEPMTDETRQANLLQGRQTPIREHNFPARQSVVKFIDEWMRSRADWLVPLMHDLVAKAAFRAILDYNLNATRIAFDTAPCYSGLRKQGDRRHDEGAKHWSHGKPYFGRQWGTMTVGDCGLILYGRAQTPQDEGELAQKVFIPKLHLLSEGLNAAAAERGIEHPGFEHAGLFGDSHFGELDTVVVAYAHGFEPGFTSKDAGKPAKIIGKRRVKVIGKEGEYAVLEMSNRGRFYCPCDEHATDVSKRRPMEQIANRFGKDFTIHCEHCHRNKIWYRIGRRGPDTDLGNGRWRRGAPSTLVRSLRHDDRRTIAVAHNVREHHEHSHSMFRHMGLLAKERLSQRKHITGDFRHDVWFALGALVHNLIIIFNLANGRVSREELDWNEQFVSGVRNGASALAGKRHRAARRVSDADKAARRSRKQRLPSTASPPLRDAA